MKSVLISFILSGAILASDVRAVHSQNAGDILGQLLFGVAQQGQSARIRRGEEIFLVKRLQTALRTLGYYSGSIDGTFGAGTQAALNSYLQATGRRPTRRISEREIQQIEMEAQNAPTSEDMAGETEDSTPLSYSPVADQTRWLRKDLTMVNSPKPIVIKAPDKGVWLVVASARTLEEVRPVAKLYAEDFPATIIVRSVNGVYAILVGWLPADEARTVFDVFKAQSIIPSDSFLSGGERFLSPIWSTGSKSIKVRRDLLRFALFRATPHVWARAMQNNGNLANFNARVVGLDQETGTFSFLSLRKAPATTAEEVSRLPDSAVLQILESREGWHRVRLLSGTEGWVSGAYVAFNDAVLSGAAGVLAEGDEDNQAAASSGYDQALQDQLLAKGNEMVADVDIFLKTNSDVKNIGELAELVSTLRTSMVDQDFAKMEVAVTTLGRLLGQIPEFQAFVASRQSQRLAAEKRALEENRTKADKNIFFLKQYISKNITSPDISKFVGLLKEFQGLPGDANLATVTSLNNRLDEAVSQGELANQYSSILADYIKPATVVQLGASTDANKVGRPADTGLGSDPAKPDSQSVDRAALEAARKSATELIDQLNAFSKSGRQIASSIDIARLMVSLKASMRQNDITGTIRDERALRALVMQDQGFSTFIAAQSEARTIASAKALDAARSELQRINGFLITFMTNNFTSEKLEQIVPMQEQAEAALKSPNVDVMLGVVRQIRDRLVVLGLGSLLEGYKLPDESASKKAGDALINEAKLATLTKNANNLLDRLKRLDVLERPLTDPLKIARAASVLRKALRAALSEDLEKATAELEQALSGETAWTTLVEKDELAQASSGRETQATALAEGRRLSAFITKQVTKSVAADGVDALLAAQDKLEAALSSKQTVELLIAVKESNQTIKQLGLAGEMESFTLQTADETAKAKRLKETENELIVSDANRQILEGPEGDLLALFNATGEAKHVSRTLTGSFAFNEGALVCWYQPAPEESIQTRLLYAKLKEAGAKSISIAGPCRGDFLIEADVVMLRKGDFVKTERSYAKALVVAFENKELIQLAFIPEADVKAEENSREDKRTKLRSDIGRSLRDGFGFVLFENDSGQLCRTDTIDRPAHSQFLETLTEPLTGEFASSSKMVDVDKKFAYRDIQAGHCQILYSDAKLIDDVLKASDRDGITANLSPIFIESKEITAAAQRIAGEEARRKQDEEKRKTELANEALEQERLRIEEKSRRATETEQLRQQNTSKATGLSGEVAELVKQWIEAPAGQADNTLTRLYPDLKDWLNNKNVTGWELADAGHQTQLVDYGYASWQDRRIEAVIIDLTINLENSAIGKYETTCYRLAFLDDKEFKMWREPVETLCSEPDPTEDWKIRHSFESLWTR